MISCHNLDRKKAKHQLKLVLLLLFYPLVILSYMFYNHLCLIKTANTCNHTAVSGLLHHHQFNRRHTWPLLTSRPPPSVRDMVVWHWQRNNPRWWLYIMARTSGSPTGTTGTTIGITRWIDSLLHSSQTSHPRQPLWGTSNAVRCISSGGREGRFSRNKVHENVRCTLQTPHRGITFPRSVQ